MKTSIVRYESCEAYLRAKGMLIDGPTRVVARERRILSLRDIKLAVCAHFGLSESQIVGDQRAREIARPRQIVMYLAKEHTTKSLPQIGSHLGDRDHTTVIHGIKQIRALLITDPEIAASVAQLESELS